MWRSPQIYGWVRDFGHSLRLLDGMNLRNDLVVLILAQKPNVDGGTDVADVLPRLQGRSVEEGCKAGGGQLAPGAVAAGLGCGQELGGGCKAGSSRP